jgi:hypothetical protein
MPHPIQIDEEQNLAIRTEVAERLRTMHSLEGRQGATSFSAINRSDGRSGASDRNSTKSLVASFASGRRLVKATIVPTISIGTSRGPLLARKKTPCEEVNIRALVSASSPLHT